MSGFRSTSNVRLVLMLACGRGWGEQGSSTPAHRLCCGADLRSSSGGVPVPLCGGSGRTSLIDQASVRLVVGQPPWAVEDRKPAIRVFVHAHGHLDEVMPVALLGNLEHTSLVAHRVVLADHTLVLDAQDVVERPDARSSPTAPPLQRKSTYPPDATQ